jgi:cupin 2 domain-containing protein
MTLKNLLNKPNEPNEGEFFEDLIKNGNFRLERIVSFGNKTPEGEWYDQDKCEWVSLIQGKAIIAFENNKKYFLFAGDYIIIAAHQKHRVEYTSKDAIWLTLHYATENKNQIL